MRPPEPQGSTADATARGPYRRRAIRCQAHATEGQRSAPPFGSRWANLEGYPRVSVGPFEVAGGPVEEAAERVVDQSADRLSARRFDGGQDVLVLVEIQRIVATVLDQLIEP